MIRVTGTIPASEGVAEEFRPLEIHVTSDGKGIELSKSPGAGPRDSESFDLSYTKEEGWTDPDARILMKISRKMRGVTDVRLLPYRGGHRTIQPTLDGTEEEVASTIVAIGGRIHPSIEDLNVESDSPIGDEPDKLH
jgi:hypothetical protein